MQKMFLIKLWLLVLVGVLLGLHILSVGRFMPLDLPDEAWLGDVADHFAKTGSLAAPADSIPTAVLQRYYVVMGLWLKLAGYPSLSEDQKQDAFINRLVTLRLFPLLVGGIAVGLCTWALKRDKQLTSAQVLAGLITLLSYSAFVRASHNLRADVGLAVYGAWLLCFRNHSSKSAFLAGLGLLIGLESVPMVALAFGAAWVVMQTGRMHHAPTQTPKSWPLWAVYGLGCGLALLIYAGLHFLPDVGRNWGEYQQFGAFYARAGIVGLRWPLDEVFNYHLHFSLVLSPMELLITGAAFGMLWRRGDKADQRLVAAVALSIGLTLISTRAAYSYWAILAPFAAYAVAQALRSQRALTIGVCVLLPALSAPTILDLTAAIQQDANAAALYGADLMTRQFPAGTTVVSEDIFWFTLAADHTFIPWAALQQKAALTQTTLNMTLEAINPDAMICLTEHTACATAARQTGLFAPPTTFYIKRQGYFIFTRG